MLDAILQIIDRLIKLTEIREDRKRSAFENHVTPIFNELKTIYDDYNSILNDTRALLEQPDTTFLEIFQILRKRREEYERIRIEVTRYTDILTNADNNVDKDIQKFAATAITIIRPTMPSQKLMSESLYLGPSRVRQLLSQFRLILSSKNPTSIEGWSRKRPVLLAVLKCFQYDLKEQWNAVCDEYYNLKLACQK